MDDATKTSSVWGILILVFLFFIVFNNGTNGIFGRGNIGECAPNNYNLGCHGTSNCEVEKQTIINTATTQFKILEQGEQTREQASRIYEAQQAEKMFDLKLNAQTTALMNAQALASKDNEISMLKNQRYIDAKFEGVDRQLWELNCSTPKRPPYYAQGYVPFGERIPQNASCC